ncbi:nuclear transport factor 2 family protein [Mycobacterium colombiense]
MNALELAQRWTALWNGEFDIAESLLAAEFRIHFGDNVAGAAGDAVRKPADMAAYIRNVHRQRPGTIFDMDMPIVADSGRFAMRWSARGVDGQISGIDVAHLSDGQIAEVWSVAGSRRI